MSNIITTIRNTDDSKDERITTINNMYSEPTDNGPPPRVTPPINLQAQPKKSSLYSGSGKKKRVKISPQTNLVSKNQPVLNLQDDHEEESPLISQNPTEGNLQPVSSVSTDLHSSSPAGQPLNGIMEDGEVEGPTLRVVSRGNLVSRKQGDSPEGLVPNGKAVGQEDADDESQEGPDLLVGSIKLSHPEMSPTQGKPSDNNRDVQDEEQTIGNRELFDDRELPGNRKGVDYSEEPGEEEEDDTQLPTDQQIPKEDEQVFQELGEVEVLRSGESVVNRSLDQAEGRRVHRNSHSESSIDQVEINTGEVSLEHNAVASSVGGRFLKFDIEIGRGSFKTVYKGLDTETGVAVAWCELSTSKMSKSDKNRFVEETKMLKNLQHPNILGFYDWWDVPERKKVILVTELMTSGTLKGYMRRLKEIKTKFIRSWGRQILQGLHYLHTRNPPVIHRDLKCDNIFINGTTGLVKIGDLGLATLKVSHVKTVIGTPEFMAPEMYDEHYDESVDVYAFGMCLIEMSTLEYPYIECSNPAQIYKKVTSGVKPESLDKMTNHVLKEIAAKCTKKDKEERYTVEELLTHSFFTTTDFKIEVISSDDDLSPDEVLPNIVKFRIARKKAGEDISGTAFEFSFDIVHDETEDILADMVNQGIINPEDMTDVSKLIERLVAEEQSKQTGQDLSSSPVQPKGSSEDGGDKTDSASTSPQHQNNSDPSMVEQNSTSTASPEDLTVGKMEDLEGFSDSSSTVMTIDSSQMFTTARLASSSEERPAPARQETLSIQEGSSLNQIVAPLSVPNLPSSQQEEVAKLPSKISKVAATVTPGDEVGSVGGGNEKHRKQRPRGGSRLARESKRPMKLVLERVEDGDLVKCQFTNSGEQINFNFSLRVDKPEALASNLSRAHHLQPDQVEEFLEMANGVIQEAKMEAKKYEKTEPKKAQPTDEEDTQKIVIEEGVQRMPIIEEEAQRIHVIEEEVQKMSVIEEEAPNTDSSGSSNVSTPNNELPRTLAEPTTQVTLNEERLPSVEPNVTNLTAPYVPPQQELSMADSCNSNSECGDTFTTPLISQPNSVTSLNSLGTSFAHPHYTMPPAVDPSSVVLKASSQPRGHSRLGSDLGGQISHHISNSPFGCPWPYLPTYPAPQWNQYDLDPSTLSYHQPLQSSTKPTLQQAFPNALLHVPTLPPPPQPTYDNSRFTVESVPEEPSSEDVVVRTAFTVDSVSDNASDSELEERTAKPSDISQQQDSELVSPVQSLSVRPSSCDDTIAKLEQVDNDNKDGSLFSAKDLKVVDGAFGIMLYSMIQMLKNPKVEGLVEQLEKKYGRSSPPKSTTSDQTRSSFSSDITQYEDDSEELKKLKKEMELERRKLEKKQRQKLMEYQEKGQVVKRRSSAMPAINLDPRSAMTSPGSSTRLISSAGSGILKEEMEEVKKQNKLPMASINPHIIPGQQIPGAPLLYHQYPPPSFPMPRGTGYSGHSLARSQDMYPGYQILPPNLIGPQSHLPPPSVLLAHTGQQMPPVTYQSTDSVQTDGTHSSMQ